MKSQLETITSCLTNLSSSIGVTNTALSSRPSYASMLNSASSNSNAVTVQPTTQKLDNKFCTEVLSAVHAELSTKEHRSKNLFVTGLPISQFGSDADQFVELCSTQLDIHPTVTSTFRLKKKNFDPSSVNTSNTIPPLLVTLESTDEVNLIMKWARELRNSTSRMVRNNIFINRHLTKAEALAAYNEMTRRRMKNQSSSTSITADASNIEVVPPVRQRSDQPSTSDKQDEHQPKLNTDSNA